MLQLNFNPFPVLTTDRLQLRQITSEDVHEIYHLRSDPSIMKYIPRPLAKSLEDATSIIDKINEGVNNSESISWAITLKDVQKLIGTIGYVRMNKEHYRAEIGYMLHNNFQGKAIMQEALVAILQYGNTVMKLHSIEAAVSPENISSVKLLEKNKFIKEAYFKENQYYNNRFNDTVIYTLLNASQH